MIKSKTKSVVWLAFGLLLLAILVVVVIQRRQNDQRLMSATTERIANQYATWGTMQKIDYDHIQIIEDKARNKGHISDDDIDWEVQFLHAHASPGNNEEIARTTALFALEYLRTVSQSQEKKLYNVILPLLSDDAKYNDNTDKVHAIALMGVLKDPRAIPILAHLQSSDPAISVHAKEAIDKIEHHS